jgi:hypothetical protein
MLHHTIAVTTNIERWAAPAHAKAVAIFGDGVTPIFETKLNGVWSFFVLPDGSKEGWEASDEGDARRFAFVAWLDAQRYDDDSTPYHWVEVAIGSDEPDETEIIAAWTCEPSPTRPGAT